MSLVLYINRQNVNLDKLQKLLENFGKVEISDCSHGNSQSVLCEFSDNENALCAIGSLRISKNCASHLESEVRNNNLFITTRSHNKDADMSCQLGLTFDSAKAADKADAVFVLNVQRNKHVYLDSVFN